jgi:putative chitinase
MMSFAVFPFAYPAGPRQHRTKQRCAIRAPRCAEAGLTEAGLQLIFIHAGTTRVRTFYQPLCSCMTNYGIRSPLEVAHFLAQVEHECMELRYTEELASGAAYEGRADLGNTQPGDGVPFKGRGLIQLTGRFNYEAYGNAIGRNLLTDAGARTVSTDPSLAIGVAGWFWSTHNLNALAGSDDVLGVTRIVNGGNRGIADRRRILSRAKFLLVERQFVRS